MDWQRLPQPLYELVSWTVAIFVIAVCLGILWVAYQALLAIIEWILWF